MRWEGKNGCGWVEMGCAGIAWDRGVLDGVTEDSMGLQLIKWKGQMGYERITWMGEERMGCGRIRWVNQMEWIG